MVPADDEMSPFVKKSKLWTFEGSCLILVPWYNEKVVNILIINQDNCSEVVRILRKAPSRAALPVVHISQKLIPRIN